MLLLLNRFSCVRLCETHQAHHRWDSPGKNTGVGCHFLLQCMKVKSESEVAQSCPTCSDPMGCSPPGSSVHRIFQARVLEWGAIAFSKIIHYWLSIQSLDTKAQLSFPGWSQVPWVVRASLVAQMVKNLPAMQKTLVRPPGQDDPLDKGMATRSSILAWKIPWTEEPGGLQPTGSLWVRLLNSRKTQEITGEGNGKVIHGVTKRQTRLSDFTFIFHFHALEKEMAAHSSVLAWRIPAMAEPGGLLSMGSHRVGHDWSNLAAEAAAGNNYKLPFPWTQNPYLSDFTGEFYETFREEIITITIWHISENRAEGNILHEVSITLISK